MCGTGDKKLVLFGLLMCTMGGAPPLLSFNSQPGRWMDPHGWMDGCGWVPGNRRDGCGEKAVDAGLVGCFKVSLAGHVTA